MIKRKQFAALDQFRLVAAVLVSSISTMRLKPKQILAQME